MAPASASYRLRSTGARRRGIIGTSDIDNIDSDIAAQGSADLNPEMDELSRRRGDWRSHVKKT